MAQVAVRAHCPACGQPATLAGSYSDETFNGQCVACKGVIAAPNPKYDPSKNVQAFSSVVIGDKVVSGYNLKVTEATKPTTEMDPEATVVDEHKFAGTDPFPKSDALDNA